MKTQTHCSHRSDIGRGKHISYSSHENKKNETYIRIYEGQRIDFAMAMREDSDLVPMNEYLLTVYIYKISHIQTI